MNDRVARVKRIGDYTEDQLVLTRTDDGDIGVMIGFSASVTFCNPRNGGYSPRTIEALYNLFEAMQKDEDERPDPRDPKP